MAFKLASFCRDAGAELITDYITSVLQERFPASELPKKPRDAARFLHDFIEGLPDDKNRRAWGDVRRVDLLSGAAGQESLRQSLDPGDWSRRVCSHESARQRALFCWLKRGDAFLAAEIRKEQKLKRQNLRYAATFESVSGRETSSLDVDPSTTRALNALLQTALSGTIRRGTDCVFLAAEVRSEVTRTPEKVFQLGIRWTDGTSGSFRQGHGVVDFSMTDQSQVITMTYFPSSGRIIVTGKKLKDEDFSALADLFAARVLRTPHKPIPALPDLIMPENFLRTQTLKLPPRLQAERIGFERIVLVLPRTRKPFAIPLEPGMPILQSVARDMGDGFARGIVPLSEVRAVRLEVHMTPDKLTGKARKFRIDASASGIKLSSTLDCDLLFAETFLELNGVLVRAKDIPLFARAIRR